MKNQGIRAFEDGTVDFDFGDPGDLSDADFAFVIENFVAGGSTFDVLIELNAADRWNAVNGVPYTDAIDPDRIFFQPIDDAGNNFFDPDFEARDDLKEAAVSANYFDEEIAKIPTQREIIITFNRNDDRSEISIEVEYVYHVGCANFILCRFLDFDPIHANCILYRDSGIPRYPLVSAMPLGSDPVLQQIIYLR
jgi:hypothetical protein